jgi:ubiquinone/menaquinone biosynthesis C-methylase UbiE
MPITYLTPDPTPTQRSPRTPEDYEPMQHLTREIAFDHGWNDERRERIRQRFDGLAPEWSTIGGGRQQPLRDALARGGLADGGLCLEVGSGTGMQTPPLTEKFTHVISLDLAPEMLGLTVPEGSVSLGRADASLLPVRSASVEAIAVVNMFLFPEEYWRVLKPGGRLIFVSTSGDQTPIYLSPVDVAAALAPVAREIPAVSSGFGFGTWTVLTKA